MSRFFGTRWPRIFLAVAVAAALASFLPKIPRDQTIRVDLGPLAASATAVTIRWAPEADRGENEANQGARSANIEDWTGEVTFRYEKDGAPRVIEKEIRAADGDYVLEIEVEGEGGHAMTTKEISFAGGSVTVEAADLALPRRHGAEDAAP